MLFLYLKTMAMELMDYQYLFFFWKFLLWQLVAGDVSGAYVLEQNLRIVHLQHTSVLSIVPHKWKVVLMCANKFNTYSIHAKFNRSGQTWIKIVWLMKVPICRLTGHKIRKVHILSFNFTPSKIYELVNWSPKNKQIKFGLSDVPTNI